MPRSRPPLINACVLFPFSFSVPTTFMTVSAITVSAGLIGCGSRDRCQDTRVAWGNGFSMELWAQAATESHLFVRKALVGEGGGPEDPRC